MFGGGGLNSYTKVEDDYMILVKYLRKWQQGIQFIKQARQEHRRLLELMAVAINYHEQQLRTKTLLSFIKYRIDRERERENFFHCKSFVEFNIRKFYFVMLV